MLKSPCVVTQVPDNSAKNLLRLWQVNQVVHVIKMVSPSIIFLRELRFLVN